MKTAIKQSFIFVIIIAFSFGFGFLFDRTCILIENKTHTIDATFADAIIEYSHKYGVDSALVFALIKTESNFTNEIADKDGKVGVMALSPTTFAFVKNTILSRTNEDNGLIYNPEKNVEYGIAYLSYLKTKYANDRMVLTAYLVGTDTLDEWLDNEDAVKNGMILKKIPDRKISKEVYVILKHYKIYSRILAIDINN